MNKGGWLKIVEAFAAIMLILSVTLIVIQKNYATDENISEKIYEVESEILEGAVKEYEIKILEENLTQEDMDTYLTKRVPNYLVCSLITCDWGACDLEPDKPLGVDLSGKAIYTQSAIILNDKENKELRLFCWLR